VTILFVSSLSNLVVTMEKNIEYWNFTN